MFQAVTEKRCEKHFKKECWIDYNEQANSQTVRICTIKPQRKCDLTLEEKKQYKLEAWLILYSLAKFFSRALAAKILTSFFFFLLERTSQTNRLEKDNLILV